MHRGEVLSKSIDGPKVNADNPKFNQNYIWFRIVSTFKARYFLTLTVGLLAIFPGMALVLLVTYAFSQLQGQPRALTWSELLGEHASRWIGPIVRNTALETGLSVEFQKWYFPVLLLAAALSTNFLRGLQEYLLEDLGERYCRDLRNSITDKFLKSNYPAAKETSASLLANFLGEDSREVRQSFTRLCGSIPTELFNSFFYLCFLALLDTQLFILFFSIFLPVGLIIRLTGNHLRKLAKTGIRIQTELSQSFLEKARGWQSVQTFSSHSIELFRFNGTNSTIFHVWRRSARAKAMSSPTVEWLGITAGACVLVLALRRVNEGALANTILTAFLVTVAQLSNSLQTTVNQLNGAKKGSAALARVLDYIDKMLADKRTNALSTTSILPASQQNAFTLWVNGVSLLRSGKNDEFLFKDLDFILKTGESILICGPSGQGKSTLLECICGLRTSDRGRIALETDGQCFENQMISEHASVTYLTQDPFIFAGTVGENVCYPARINLNSKSDVDRVRTALDKSCLKGLSIDSSVLSLSGGEKQRLAFARGFFAEPDVWVIDEGTSALDLDTEQQLLCNLRTEAKKSIQIFVAHRPMTQQFVDKIVTIEQPNSGEST
jgi:ABC-type multidrug transport system fused ATPase/permease subunit